MAQQHPDNAVYVAKDKKSGAEVSFDQWGRKLDSVGNVVAGDRQRAGDAGAKPREQRQEQPKGPPAQPTAASYTFPANATGLPVQRSGWDKSIVQPAVGAASAAGVSGAQRGNNPNTLAPGGIDNSFLGLPYPTASNGLLGSAWAKPWRGGQQQSAPANIQMQTGGLNVAPTSGAADFMAGNNPYSPVQPKVNAPGFGQLPSSIPMQTDSLGSYALPQPAQGPVFDPYQNANMPITDPLAIYRQGVSPMPGDMVGPQNFGRNLDVSAYMPGGARYTGSWR